MAIKSDKDSELNSQFDLLVKLQEPEGYWKMQSLIQVVGLVNESIIVKAIPADLLKRSPVMALNDIWATLVVLAILKLRYKEKRSHWMLLWKKAHCILNKENIREDDYEDVIEGLIKAIFQ